MIIQSLGRHCLFEKNNTMLKTKIFIPGILCQGFVLIVAAGNSTIKNPLFSVTFNKSMTASNSSFKTDPVQRIKINPGIEKFSSVYNQANTKLFKQINERNQQHFTIMDRVFLQYDLPVQLKYLAVVESKLKSTAISGCGAKGYWQLMPATAKLFGLKITAQQDDRTNCYKSTMAAAKYLKELYAKFNDWLLVIAAYNGGAGTVYKAIKKSGSRDFWKLQYFLPRECRIHVKKYISTHYYFEGQGGLTTMGKKETEEYIVLSSEYIKSSGESVGLKTDPFLPGQNDFYPNKWFVIIRNEKRLAVLAKI